MKLKLIRIISSLLITALLGSVGLSQTEITLARFLGDCEQAGTNIQEAVGEACIIQSIINNFSEQDNGITVNTLPTDWGNYYDQIKAMYAGGNAPEVHMIHKSRLPEFASIGVITDLTEDLAEIGVDVSDWTDSAIEAITYNDRIYAVPMDSHANLWHVNLDLLAQAGLVNDDGTPILPSSPEEMLEQAKLVREATGKDYLAADFSQFPIGVRLVLSLVWQQNGEVFTADKATVNTPEVRLAVETITNLFDAGYADPNLNYADSQQAFLDGEAAVLINGTWVVDFYDAQAKDPNVALTNYYVSDFPTLFDTPATWADSHMWAIPSNLKRDDPEKYQAALKLLAWINDNNLDWARTGHMSVRRSVLASEAYNNLPHRSEYANTTNIVRDVLPTVKYGAIQDVLNRELQAIWLTGKSIDDALTDAENAVQDLLR